MRNDCVDIVTQNYIPRVLFDLQTEGGPKEWTRKHDSVPGSVKFDGSQNKADVKSLQSYCHA
jgi:hypothetical protein